MTDKAQWDSGTRVRVSDGILDAGRCGTVVSREVLIMQWWCPVLWDDEKDPYFSKSSCLELLGELDQSDWLEILHLLLTTEKPSTALSGGVTAFLAIASKISGEIGDLEGRLTRDDWAKIHLVLEEAWPSSACERRPRLRAILGKMPFEREEHPAPSPFSQEELLAMVYPMASSSVAELCDGRLDKSGALLGRVRNAARKLGDKVT